MMRSLQLGERGPFRGGRGTTFVAITSLTWILAADFACTGKISQLGRGAPPPTGAGGSGTGGGATMATAGAAGTTMTSGAGGSTTTTGGTGVIGGTGTGGSAPALDCSQPAPGPAPLRRLTRFEYSNTLRDLLGDTTSPGDQLPPELKGNGFSNDATSLTTPRLLVDAYQSVAHDIALRATKDATTLASTTKCDTTKMSEDACAQAFVTSLGARAFRRPLDAGESTSILGVYKAVRPAGTYADAIAAIIEMVLQSPQFLYRPEVGVPVAGKSVARVAGYEMAVRLSYTLWGTTPDQILLDAAKSGQLETKEQVQAQAMRMVDDPHAKDVSHFFHNTWLGINGLDGLQRDTTWFRTYTPALAALFRQETEQFLDYVIWKNNGDLATIFTAPFTFLNGPLSKFYGFGNVTATDNNFQLVNTDGKQRAGILSQSSILTATTPGSHNNPVVRGKFVYTQLLCGSVPDPPAALMVKEPTPDPTLTMRELFLAHRTEASCNVCHQALDPIGFGLENYNGVGLWQDTDNGKPVDASGNVPDHDIAGPFNGPVELGKKLASSADVQKCYVGKWLTFAYGRVETPTDACNRVSLQTAFSAANGNIRQLMVALTQTDAFLYRPLAQ
jgi:hypothetical protein